MRVSNHEAPDVTVASFETRAKSALLRMRTPRSLVRDFRKSDLHVQPLLQKYFRSLRTQITCISLAIPSRTEGRFAIVTDVGRGAVDVDGATDESA